MSYHLRVIALPPARARAVTVHNMISGGQYVNTLPRTRVIRLPRGRLLSWSWPLDTWPLCAAEEQTHFPTMGRQSKESPAVLTCLMRSFTQLELSSASAGSSSRLIFCTPMFLDLMHSPRHVQMFHTASTFPQENAFSCCCVKTQNKRPLFVTVQLGDNVAQLHEVPLLVPLRGLPLLQSSKQRLVGPESNVARNVCRETSTQAFAESSNPLPSLNLCTASTPEQVLEIHT